MPFPILHPKIDTSPPSCTWLSTTVANPGAGAVLIDSGALPAGSYEFWFACIVDPGNALVCQIEHRNSTNLVTLHELRMTCPTTQAANSSIPRFNLSNNERMRVLTAAAEVGNVYSSLMYRRVA